MADEQHILQCLSARPHLRKIIERHRRHQTLRQLIQTNLQPALAKHCLSANIQGDALILHIDQSSAAHSIRLAQQSLLTAICQAFPQKRLPANRLVIKIQHATPMQTPCTAPPSEPCPLPLEARQLLNQAATHLKHPALAKAMHRLAQKNNEEHDKK